MNSTALEAILDVAIGMVFMWLILSVATMSIQEWIASYLKWRANDLETAIRGLLASNVWAEQLYRHPLIKGLSKKAGRRPSYIPANKFALALFDLVKTAGTQESFIQQMLLTADRELNRAPRQIGPFLVYIFKRFGTNIQKVVYRILFFFGVDIGTPDQKYEEMLTLTQRSIHSNDPKNSEDLAKSLKEIFAALISDETNVNDKTVSIPSANFLKAYPTFHNYFFQLIKASLMKQPLLRLQWAQKLINDNTKLVEEVRKNLKEGENLDEKLHDMAENLAIDFNIEHQNLNAVIQCVKESLDQIDFAPMVNYIQNLVGDVPQGLPALQKLNPPLHKSLQQLYGDIVGIANNTQMLNAVRTRFAIAALNVEKAENNLQAMRLNSETWFNESMDRLSGWYKRKATILAFIIGLILAAILNVDSIALIDHLWREPAVREALVANATEFSKQNPTVPVLKIDNNKVGDAVTYFNDQFKGLSLPIGWTFEEQPLKSYIVDQQNKYETCSLLPIGRHKVWGIQKKDSLNKCFVINNIPADAAAWAVKILGIIFSAAAAAQGAPFWFDILKKLVNIRGSGANPDEKSKKSD